MYNDTRPPLERMISDAENLQTALQRACTDLELAIEQRHLADKAFSAAETAYFAQEEELPFIISVNAEKFTVARTEGVLSQAWRALNQATTVRDEAELAHAQMGARFKAVLTAAKLQAAMLRAAAVG